MSNILTDDGDKIQTNTNISKFKSYIREPISELNNYNYLKYKEPFIRMVNDFRSGTLSLDDLSEFANILVAKPDDKDSHEVTEFKEVVLAASELNFYVRRIPDLVKNNFVEFLTLVVEYAKKNS